MSDHPEKERPLAHLSDEDLIEAGHAVADPVLPVPIVEKKKGWMDGQTLLTIAVGLIAIGAFIVIAFLWSSNKGKDAEADVLRDRVTDLRSRVDDLSDEVAALQTLQIDNDESARCRSQRLAELSTSSARLQIIIVGGLLANQLGDEEKYAEILLTAPEMIGRAEAAVDAYDRALDECT